jgi:predicted ATP-binding protein involved in virulence
LLTAIHNPDLPSRVLMDDFDHGLHLSAQYEVIAAIRRVMARRPELQVIGTSHSPVLLDSFDKKEVRVMALGPDGLARIQPLSAHPPVDGYRAGFSSGELWANLGEDWVANG